MRFYILIFSFSYYMNVQKAQAVKITPTKTLSLPEQTSDFYNWVNHDFFQNNSIPDDKSSWGYFNILAQESKENQHTLLQNLSTHTLPDPHHQQLLSTFWNKCQSVYDHENIPEIKNYISNAIAECKHPELGVFLANLTKKGLNPFTYFGSTFDYNDSSLLIAGFGFGGLSLGDKDYYFNDEHAETREKFNEYLQKLGDVVGRDFRGIFQWEKEIANFHYTKEEKRDPHKNNNVHDLSQFYAISPHMESFMENCGYMEKFGNRDIHKINISNPEGLKSVLGKLEGESYENLENIIFYKAIKSLGALFSKQIDEINFDFFSRHLNGQKEQKPLWERRLGLANGSLGELIGRLYVEKYFDNECRQVADEMIATMIETFRSRIGKLEWMKEETRQLALDKLNKMRVKIGFSTKIEDYSTLNFDNSLNILQINEKLQEWEYNNEFNEMYAAPDKEKWEMNPQDVNAYFHPLLNEIVFPAAILQPPFFDKDAGLEWNYGGIGMVICHEITHAFDDKGRKFDSSGNLKDWWQPEDAEKFEQCITTYEEQFGALELEGVKIKPALVMGEALADHGGVNVALAALKNTLGDATEKDENGFTYVHRYFLSVARVWANMRTAAYTKQLATTDPHPHPLHRVNITLANTNEFYECFSAGEWTVPEEKRLKLW
jgi:putative endopeptidase